MICDDTDANLFIYKSGDIFGNKRGILSCIFELSIFSCMQMKINSNNFRPILKHVYPSLSNRL